MATIKSFTSLEQSKKLAEILPLESVDMWYHGHCSPLASERTYDDEPAAYHSVHPNWDLPCWSLSALLDVLPDRTCVYKKTYKDGRVKYQGIAEGTKELILRDNPIDACYEIILKLKEKDIL